MRSGISDITEFSYEGIIRILKTKDVADYYQNNSLGLVDEILISLNSYQEFWLNQKYSQAKEDQEYQIIFIV